MNNNRIELNEQFKKALEIIENTNKNIFITGKAGTGKSTLLDYFRSVTGRKIVVLAPTGVAALNVRGETIHSFFGFKPDVTLQNIPKLSKKKAKTFKKLDAIIIDEISMVRADLLDCVDRFLRLNGKQPDRAFGGIQMIFIGDLYQLPPVVKAKEKKLFRNHYHSEYFFDANVFKSFSMEFIELEKIYRQKDEDFIQLLNDIRNNTITEEGLAILNGRVGAKFSSEKYSDYVVHLTTLNKMAYKINTEHLDRLKRKMHKYEAEIYGNFNKNSYPTDFELYLKTGAQIMMLNNDARGRWVNGSIGKVVNIRFSRKENCDIISVQFPGGRSEYVLPYTWDIFHFRFNEENRMIETETVGSFSQYPLRLAWAVTIHKSQGKTFDKVIIDIGRGTFACGQVYVALSRCTSFEGIKLKKPIKKTNIFTDWRIVNFLTKYQYKLSERDMPLEEKMRVINQAIEDKSSLEIVYLKPNDEKSQRIIMPYLVGEHFYQGKSFIGLSAYCSKRKEERIFRVDRILQMRLIT
jgi:ATP-dependent DNA helicase PIF1